MHWGGGLAGWGQPFCAESKVDENGEFIPSWTCDSDEDNLDCSEDHVVSLIVHDVNAAVSDFDFEFPEGRSVEVQFYDTSVPGEGAAIMVEWDWVFGDGTTYCCNQPNPSHEYQTSGQYDVSLTATDSMGNVDTRVRQIDTSNMRRGGELSGKKGKVVEIDNSILQELTKAGVDLKRV
jgi:hypothetical protein